MISLCRSVPLSVLFLFSLLHISSPTATAQDRTVITITDSVIHDEVKPFGINIGSRNRWGEAQFLKNLIDNPGFEPGVMGMVALAAPGSTPTTFRQAYWNTDWGGHSEGFWDSADYEIVWGAAKGRSGTIREFRHENGAYVFDLGETGTAPGENDVMFVRTTVPGIGGDTAISAFGQGRPGSPGIQALRLKSGETDVWNFYMDSYWRDGDRSIGKMLPVEGKWRCAVWAKGIEGGESGRVTFFREGEAIFLEEGLALTDEWQLFEWEFDVEEGIDPIREYGDGEYRPILGFRLEAVEGTVLFDDVALERNDETNPTVFTDLFVERLKELRPGILRNWGTQFGATLETELSVAFERGTNGYKPGGGPDAWGYSLHEFLELADEVGAEPWYVIPPTFSAEDLQNLIEYLAAPATLDFYWGMERASLGQVTPWTQVFPVIHLEFGNELWGSAEGNDPFQGASVRGGVRLGQITSDRFGILREHEFYEPVRLNLIVGGQAGYPGRQQELEVNGREHDAVALAPYFGILNTWTNDQEIFGPLLAHPTWQSSPEGEMAESYGYLQEGGQGTKPAIYEINFHTTGGNAPIDVRNDYLTSAAGALALPLAMLTYQREFGVLDQAAFTSLGYSFRIGNGEYARVWGMLRDLYATGRKRPTWLGLELANRGIDLPGESTQVEMLAVEREGADPFRNQPPINGIGGAIDVPFIQAFAYRRDELPAEYGLVVFNLDLENGHDVEVRAKDLPHLLNGRNGIPFVVRDQIAPLSIHDDNEDSVAVRIASDTIQGPFGPVPIDNVDGLNLTLPPHSITLLRWAVFPSQGVEEGGEAAVLLYLPNPATSDSPVMFELPERADVGLDLFDATGAKVRRLTGGEMESGRHVVSLRGGTGEPLPSGLYLLRLSAGEQTVVKKLVVIE